MERIQITQRFLRKGLNSKPMRNRIQQYNDFLTKEDKETDFKKLRKRFQTRSKRSNFSELKELKKRGFF